MSYNGSGVYTLPGAQLATGATVSATENNQFRNDVAAALNTAWTRDGQAPATNDIPMGSNKITELAAPTTAGDALAFGANATVDDLTVSGDSSVSGNSSVTGNQTVTGNLSVGGSYIPAYGIGKNRIINGAMMIDQRNAGASVTPTDGQYPIDRWLAGVSQASKFTVQQNAGSVTPPAGFINYLGVTSSSAYSVLTGDYFFLRQIIEGFNVADLGWGTANAATVTLSFWVRSSLTGTFGGALGNGAPNRSYPFTYTISAANTWEQKTLTIPGDTTGTWLTNNGQGLRVTFGLGVGSTYNGTADAWAAGNYFSATGATSVVGTSGATFYITGVQLEKGSVATPFEVRQYGTELALCQRYYWKNDTTATSYEYIGSAYINSTTQVLTPFRFPVQMRTSPTLAYTGAASLCQIATNGGQYNCTSVSLAESSPQSCRFDGINSGAPFTSNAAGIMRIALLSGTAYFSASAEL